ncbi:SDR family NAD(P)-dependent oxidoreductase [uncultured Spirosoma sp.]|uniref:SDR family NAD(P)-dependent oxidoreductase n=1 Tax=uncultured Spirosoma sp. TaxID=278208 RepID=UPI0025856CBD|nr:SDR family NAD(P)-dependent oxidoreductase [uncultured Spirosoma sp.]
MKTAPRTILITGASTGIGYGAARQFAQRGYTVFAGVRNPTDADRLSAELGPNVVPVLLDVTDDVSVHAVAQQLTERLAGMGLGGLINNAGIAIGGPLQEQPLDVVQQHFDVNVLGVLRVTQAFLPLLGARANHPVAPGRIQMISSVNGQVAIPFMGAYVGSKHALEGLSHSLRRELRLFGVSVVIVGPGAVKTPIWGKGTNIERYRNSLYFPAMQWFAKQVKQSEENGLSIDYLGGRLVQIHETRRPRIRYAIVPKPVAGWLISRLPHRLFDQLIGRLSGLRSS